MDVSLTEYHAAVDALFARTTGGVKPGLERTEAILEAVGSPHRRLRVFHVAGTNGKGSVCAALDAVLRTMGRRVGRYTSPHLVDFRERILVDGAPIPPEEVTGWLRRHDALIARLGATFFEATTALAFDYFVRAGVDVAVVETGLGGRLDSTNVIEHPLAAVVTSIGLDHTDLLGDTLEKIALEKAGIFKTGSPAVIGERDPAIAELLARTARERGASSVQRAGEAWSVDDVRVVGGHTSFILERDGASRRVRTPLIGTHQAWNAAVALGALRAAGEDWWPSASQVDAGLAKVRLAGRFQQAGDTIFDVAHNPAGAAVLARTLRTLAVKRPVVTLLAVLADKDWRGMMRELATTTGRFVLTVAPTAPAGRVWDVDEAMAFARAEGFAVEAVRDFDAALAASARGAGTRVVTGSFHTVGDAMARLQVDPLAG
ncbi:MAG: bifunctional folylpolyglutamate synthase/dihydrofolate synthase [Gemmatimonadaceae bacterium]|nr:bifunctional folylpolyglutamate synthase/dihydrofolate synthase [Gemmatimonadaceae bacterium]NUQ92077.1 bifunctional folylpolyglutamate synthase/dihydrofolate synthase [Gemmatimonadaceae bacterium]NUR20072.1 bifunctional folylpolyglutamate synthase/dihydrofolate synthase [Gemmatimonadaceae bacterium]NUS96506.1 bifunctional folylpolyglutamate synthase/dihydrofolate synthase [Gemmatimonadaceae bacterium]